MSTYRRDNLHEAMGWLVVGVLLVALDFRIGPFDLLHDALGKGFVLVAVFRLLRVAPSSRRLGVVAWLVGLSTVAEVLATFAALPRPLALGMAVADLSSVLLVVWQLKACTHALDLPRASRSWAATWWLQVAIYALPCAAWLLIGAVAWATGLEFELGIQGPVALLVVLVAFVPLAHLVLSAVRTRREGSAYRPPKPAGEDGVRAAT